MSAPENIPVNSVVVSAVDAGTLYVVATPIGNLRDITLRARDVLAQVDILCAEDTRVAGDLLRLLEIKAPRLMSVREHNEREAAVEVIDLLRAGKSIAYTSDAGTPGISDPGARLVRAIPGVSAVTALLSVSGLLATDFAFIGFLPSANAARAAAIEDLRTETRVAVMYESTHRIVDLLSAFATHFPDRELVIGKELTKHFEMVARLPAAQFPAWITEDARRLKGEFVLALAPVAAKTAPQVVEAKRWLEALAKELPPARAAKIVAKMTGVPRDELYRSMAGGDDDPES
jgi:16S rRNA (cytidine1402-2'-O)-methyltransferase